MMMIILMILGRPIRAVRYVHLTINRQRRGLFIRLVKNRVRINHLFRHLDKYASDLWRRESWLSQMY